MLSDKKISLNKLAEYMTANPSRRKQIIRDQKHPSNFKVSRYMDAREVIVNYLQTGNEKDAMEKAAKLLLENSERSFVEQDKVLSGKAIEDFLDLSDEVDLTGVDVEAGNQFSTQRLGISDLTISIRPDAILRDKNTGSVVGAVKLHFSKTAPLDEKACEYGASALRFYLENQISQSKIDPKKCYMVDVPTGKVKYAPRAFTRRLSDISAACEEISARWDKF